MVHSSPVCGRSRCDGRTASCHFGIESARSHVDRRSNGSSTSNGQCLERKFMGNSIRRLLHDGHLLSIGRNVLHLRKYQRGWRIHQNVRRCLVCSNTIGWGYLRVGDLLSEWSDMLRRRPIVGQFTRTCHRRDHQRGSLVDSLKFSDDWYAPYVNPCPSVSLCVTGGSQIGTGGSTYGYTDQVVFSGGVVWGTPVPYGGSSSSASVSCATTFRLHGGISRNGRHVWRWRGFLGCSHGSAPSECR